MTAGRRLLVALILASTAAFVVGVVLERHRTANETVETPAQRAAEAGPTSATTAGSESHGYGESGERRSKSGVGSGSGESGERHGETGETGESTTTAGPAAGKPGTAAHTEAPGHAESSEKLLGVNPESTGLLAVAVVVSLLLAAAVWWRSGSPLVLGVVAVAMAAFCALDVREVVHQANESRTGLAILAALVAALHLAAALLAARAAVAARDVPPPWAPSAPAA